MIPGTLTVVVGLPGSGKSRLIEQRRSSISGLCVEDFHARAIGDSALVEHSRHYAALVEALRTGHDCVIADIAFCVPTRREALEQALIREIPILQIEWIYFENVPERCMKNIRLRNRDDLVKDIEALDTLKNLYVIPDGITVRSVW